MLGEEIDQPAGRNIGAAEPIGQQRGAEPGESGAAQGKRRRDHEIALHGNVLALGAAAEKPARAKLGQRQKERGMLAERRRHQRRSVSLDITGADADAVMRGKELDADDVRRIGRPKANREVDALGDEIEIGVGQHQLELQPRKVSRNSGRSGTNHISPNATEAVSRSVPTGSARGEITSSRARSSSSMAGATRAR